VQSETSDQPSIWDQSPEAKKARAEARLKRREEHRIEAPKATQEYRSAEQDQRDQLAKLRAERVAREKAIKL